MILALSEKKAQGNPSFVHRARLRRVPRRAVVMPVGKGAGVRRDRFIRSNHQRCHDPMPTRNPTGVRNSPNSHSMPFRTLFLKKNQNVLPVLNRNCNFIYQKGRATSRRARRQAPIAALDFTSVASPFEPGNFQEEGTLRESCLTN